jgi:hypothetical protein
MAGQYSNPIPTRFLAPIDCSKIPALIIVQQERIPALSWTTSSLLKHSKHTTATGSGQYSTAAEFLDEIQTKVLRDFLLVIHLYSFALRFLLLQTHATSYSFCKGTRRKT